MDVYFLGGIAPVDLILENFVYFVKKRQLCTKYMDLIINVPRNSKITYQSPIYRSLASQHGQGGRLQSTHHREGTMNKKMEIEKIRLKIGTVEKIGPNSVKKKQLIKKLKMGKLLLLTG